MGVQKYSDDDILQWVRDRSRGASLKAMSARYGVNVGYLNAATSRVRADDVAQSGEPEHIVRGAYW